MRSGRRRPGATTSGSSTRSSPSKSPSRAAARNASTARRWTARSASGSGASARTRRRARLASCRAAAGERSTTGAISSNGTPNTSWSTNESRSAGVSDSSTTSSARPTESAITASRSGPASFAVRTIGSGSQEPASCSLRDLRRRSASRQIRPTTTVSQPRRSSVPPGSLRSSRSQASCTASSASVTDPSMR